jgi:uncharacterized protein YbjT (DUF2867 family)
MVGAGVLIECLEDPRVTSVLVVGRQPCGTTHPKLRELIRKDFMDYRDARNDLTGYDACFFCLGISSVGMSEPDYHRVTHDLTLAAAETLASVNPHLVFCFVSGENTDSTEKGGAMWARVKGKTENALLRLPFKAFMFRPGYIQPFKGVSSRFLLYRMLYGAFRPFYPLLQRLAPTHVTNTRNVGRAMIAVAERGYSSRVLENRDINQLGGV